MPTSLLHVYYPWNQIKSILLLNIRITKQTNPNPNPIPKGATTWATGSQSNATCRCTTGHYAANVYTPGTRPAFTSQGCFSHCSRFHSELACSQAAK